MWAIRNNKNPLKKVNSIARVNKIRSILHNRDTQVECFIPECELDDGSLARVLDVEFPKGQLIRASSKGKTEVNNVYLPFVIKFQTNKPVSAIVPIQFKDSFNDR